MSTCLVTTTQLLLKCEMRKGGSDHSNLYLGKIRSGCLSQQQIESLQNAVGWLTGLKQETS